MKWITVVASNYVIFLVFDSIAFSLFRYLSSIELPYIVHSIVKNRLNAMAEMANYKSANVRREFPSVSEHFQNGG